MRRYGIPEPYEKLKALTRGQAVTKDLLHEFIATLDIPDQEKQRLLALTPETYIGLAASLAAERTIYVETQPGMATCSLGCTPRAVTDANHSHRSCLIPKRDAVGKVNLVRPVR